MADPVGSEHLNIPLERIIPTPVPGLVIWKFPRRRLTDRNGRRCRSATYSVTHEPSGANVTGGRHFLRLDKAMRVAIALGDVPWRKRTVDWTLPMEEVRENRRLRAACAAAAEWVSLSPVKDKALLAWGKRHGIAIAYDDFDEQVAS